MKYTAILVLILLIFINKTICFQQAEQELLEQGNQDPVNYDQEITQATLNLPSDAKQDIDQWIGNYHVGKECESHFCQQYNSYLFNYHNQLQCPKSENSGIIGYSHTNNMLYMSLYAFWNHGPKTPFIATFNYTSRIQTKEGYKYTIPMSGGFDINIEPCHYQPKRNARFNKCPHYPQTPTLIVYKTDQKGQVIQECSFTLTRYFGQSIESCKKNKKHHGFFNHLAKFGYDVAVDVTKDAVESVIFV